MELSYRQQIFKKYLLSVLGFENDNYTEEFSDYLEKIAYIYKYSIILKEEDFDEKKHGDYYTFHRDVGYVHDNFSIIDILLWERNARRNINLFRKQHKTYLTSTDLSNFTYCPVAFSISNSFKLPTNRNAQIGLMLHYRNFILNFSNSKKYYIDKNYYKPDRSIVNNENKAFILDVFNSDLIYAGHIQGAKVFTSDEHKYSGQPDYIYKNNNNQFFIVEEKYRKINEHENLFFTNHKVQLASYMNLFNSGEVSYGYLVYWIYNEKGHVIECKVTKMVNNEVVYKFLVEKVYLINKFITTQSYDLNQTTFYPKKCAHCAHVMLCGHKTDRLKVVNYPYHSNHLVLYNTTYPDELNSEDF